MCRFSRVHEGSLLTLILFSFSQTCILQAHYIAYGFALLPFLEGRWIYLAGLYRGLHIILALEKQIFFALIIVAFQGYQKFRLSFHEQEACRLCELI